MITSSVAYIESMELFAHSLLPNVKHDSFWVEKWQR